VVDDIIHEGLRVLLREEGTFSPARAAMGRGQRQWQWQWQWQ
jgi:hypothetical protein